MQSGLLRCPLIRAPSMQDCREATAEEFTDGWASLCWQHLHSFSKRLTRNMQTLTTVRTTLTVHVHVVMVSCLLSLKGLGARLQRSLCICG